MGKKYGKTRAFSIPWLHMPCCFATRIVISDEVYKSQSSSEVQSLENFLFINIIIGYCAFRPTAYLVLINRLRAAPWPRGPEYSPSTDGVPSSYLGHCLWGSC